MVMFTQNYVNVNLLEVLVELRNTVTQLPWSYPYTVAWAVVVSILVEVAAYPEVVVACLVVAVVLASVDVGLCTTIRRNMSTRQQQYTDN